MSDWLNKPWRFMTPDEKFALSMETLHHYSDDRPASQRSTADIPPLRCVQLYARAMAESTPPTSERRGE